MKSKYIQASFFLLISLAMIVSSCRNNYDEMLSDSLVRKDYVPVVVEPIESMASTIPIYCIGRVSSDQQTKLSFKTGGYIAGLSSKEGAYVRKGKLLGSLRTEEIDAQVLKAERALEKAQRDLVRIQAMYADSVATLENVQDLTTLVEVSQADLRIAKYNQEYSKIVSPISGRIIQRLAEPNELVSPGQPIYVIASSGNQSYLMTVHISDKDIELVNYGTKAEVSFDAFEGQTFNATVQRIAESADPLTGTFEIELSLSANSVRLRNGLIGRAVLFPDEQKQYAKIPISSISEGNDKNVFVFIPGQSDTTAIRKAIKVVRYSNDFVWVNSQDFSNDRIITTGSAYLKDGQKIKIVQ